jgi:hypothetical protein
MIRGDHSTTEYQTRDLQTEAGSTPSLPLDPVVGEADELRPVHRADEGRPEGNLFNIRREQEYTCQLADAGLLLTTS